MTNNTAALHPRGFAKYRRALVCCGLLIIGLVLAATGLVSAQRDRWNRRSRYQADSRGGVPTWQNSPEVANDVFTFVRIRYDSHGGGRGWGGGGWRTDYRDSDLNFSLRLQQLTSLKVNPDPIVLQLTDPRLFDHPFIYIVEPGRLHFYDDEIVALRRYLLNGGFLMVDDFWGEAEYQNFRYQIKRVLPDREPEEVPLNHEIFNCVYQLKEKPQVPSINIAVSGRSRGITWEPRYDSDTSTPYYKAIKDDEGRIMVFICHNTDLGDGWEREGEHEWYFQEFSVKKAYPLGINIVTYAMTH
ncbi:MAG: DUF4159 domain-containing protein [Pirellulaceae bacterium]|nr:DUF4159 domain-containing protein [Pirellulaceae bacterium]